METHLIKIKIISKKSCCKKKQRRRKRERRVCENGQTSVNQQTHARLANSLARRCTACDRVAKHNERHPLAHRMAWHVVVAAATCSTCDSVVSLLLRHFVSAFSQVPNRDWNTVIRLKKLEKTNNIVFFGVWG